MAKNDFEKMMAELEQEDRIAALQKEGKDGFSAQENAFFAEGERQDRENTYDNHMLDRLEREGTLEERVAVLGDKDTIRNDQTGEEIRVDSDGNVKQDPATIKTEFNAKMNIEPEEEPEVKKEKEEAKRGPEEEEKIKIPGAETARERFARVKEELVGGDGSEEDKEEGKNSWKETALNVLASPVTIPLGIAASIAMVPVSIGADIGGGIGKAFAFGEDVLATVSDIGAGAVGGLAKIGELISSGIGAAAEWVGEKVPALDGLTDVISGVSQVVSDGAKAVQDGAGWVQEKADKVHEHAESVRGSVKEMHDYVDKTEDTLHTLAKGDAVGAYRKNEQLKGEEAEVATAKPEATTAKTAEAELDIPVTVDMSGMEDKEVTQAKAEVKTEAKTETVAMTREEELAQVADESKQFQRNEEVKEAVMHHGEVALDVGDTSVKLELDDKAVNEIAAQKASAAEQKIELQDIGLQSEAYVENDNIKTDRAAAMEARIDAQGIEDKLAPVLDLEEFKQAKAGLENMDDAAEHAPKAHVKEQGLGHSA